MNWLAVLVGVLGLVTIGVLVYCWRREIFKRAPTPEQVKQDVDDRVDAVRKRHETRIEALPDRQALDEFEKTFGGPK
jgi:hypothetical protein